MDNDNKDLVENENKNEIVESKNEVAENKEEPKKYNQDNLTRAIVYAAIIGIMVVAHNILGFIEGNFPWFIINTIFTIGGVVMIILTALLFFKKTMNNVNKDVPSFVVSLVALIVITFSTIGWSIDMIKNLVGAIQDLTK